MLDLRTKYFVKDCKLCENEEVYLSKVDIKFENKKRKIYKTENISDFIEGIIM